MTRLFPVVALVALCACDAPPATEFELLTARELELKVQGLQKRADEVEKKLAAAPAGPAGPSPAQMEKEKAAYEKWKQMMTAYQAGDLESTRKHIADIERDFADTRAIQEIQDVKAEMAVVGKDSIPLKAEKWFVGETTMEEGKATLVVFWEVWCPHCQREVPEMEAMYQKLKGQGLNVVGVTQVTNGKTEDDVVAFIKESGVTYPMAKVGAELGDHYGVRGIPAAALVKGGKVIWRGHPGQLDEAKLADFLKG